MFSLRSLAVSCGVLALALPALAVPTVQTLSPASGATVPSLTQILVTFSEAVTGVDANDLLVNDEAALSVSGAGAGPYVFTFTQPAPGGVNLSWDFDHGITGIGTGAYAQTTWSYTLTDTLAPTTAKIRSSVAGQELDAIVPMPGATVGALTQTEVTFSEPVSGVDAADLRVNGTPATAIAGSGAGPYTFTFPQPANGSVAFTWAAGHAIQDTAATPNAFAGGSWNVTQSAAGAGTVIINEILAASATSITDENGNQPAWIELFNPGPTPVSLAGWALTDDLADPARWLFPNRTIAAGGYLVVFASGKDRRPASGNLHASFQLQGNGGTLALVSPESPRTVVSQLAPYPVQRYDYSYGLQAGGVWRYFVRPTGATDTRPGTANGTNGIAGIAPKPHASVARGFFQDPFQLVLTCGDPAATIRYTLDGSVPIASSAAYATPLAVSATTVLRMAAFRTDTIPSEAVTHSYVFLDGVLAQPGPPYDNPAITTDNANPQPPSVGGVPFPVVWGTQANVGFPGLVTNLSANQVPADYGMDPEVMTSATKYDDNGVVSAAGKTNLERIKAGLRKFPIMSIVMKNDDMFGATGLYPNSLQKGTAYEKPCSVELLLPDGSTGFATTCGIRIHGNASREPSKNPKHGFKLNFKGDFGASSLDYRLFPDSPIEKFDDLILRADFNSSWLHWSGTADRPYGTRARDAWSKEAFRDMGGVAGHHRYVNLFINGIYWGTYDPTEQENNSFGAAYFGGDKDQYDVIDQGTLKSGTLAAYSAMTSIASPIDNPKYEQMKSYLDVPEFIDYMVHHFFIGHEDWGDDVNKNWYAVRPRTPGGTFKYLPWDQENILRSHTIDRTGVPAPASGLHPKLVTNPQYLLDFADRAHRHLVAPDGALLPAANIARMADYKALLADAIVAESARWGDYRRDVHRHPSDPLAQGSIPLYTWHGQWIAEHARLAGTYFPTRTATVLTQLRTRGLYPAQNAPQIQDNSTGAPLASRRVAAGAQIKLAFPTPLPAGTSNAGTIYFTTNGVDPRVYYTGALAAEAQTYSAPLTINATTTIKARTRNGTTWSALNEATFSVGFTPSPVRITEIMYNPPNANGGAAAEFVELQNISTQAVEMSGWYFEGLDFVFPEGFVLGPGDRIVLANNDAPATFASQYPGIAVAGYFAGALNNSGDRLALLDVHGTTVTAVTYNDRAPWPGLPDGSGPSLEIIDPAGDPNSPYNWKASTAAKGTPGATNSSLPASTVKLSEVLAINVAAAPNAGIFSPFIELQNTSGAAVDLSGWQLMAGNGYTFPAGTVMPAGGFLVVWCDTATGGSGLHAQLVFTDGVRLFNNTAGNAAPVDAVAFGNQVADFSIGRVGGAWALAQPSPGAENSAAATAAAGDVALNEWLANQGPSDTADWIEFYNRHATRPAALGGRHVQAGAQVAVVPPLTYLKSGGWLRLFAGQGRDLSELVLPAEGATLSLLDGLGAATDSAAYSAQVAGSSSGRNPDGAANVVSFGFNPTPGRANALVNYTGPTFHELLARNVSGDLAPWGSRAGWVEFFNPGATAFDLSGMALGLFPQPATAPALRFPSGTSIPAGGYLTVWLGEPQQGATVPAGTLFLGAPFNPEGGLLRLFDAADNVLDVLACGPQIADRSVGRTGGAWKLLASPTQGAANAAAATLGALTGARINEWCYRGGESDFIELYNPDALPLDISGCFLTDDPAAPALTKSQLPPLSFLAGNGWLRLYALGENATGHVNFTLDPGGEYLRLSAPDLSLIDAVSYGSLVTGEAQGRLPDGGTINLHLQPTPGFANQPMPAPTITQHPAGVTRTIGSSASFSALASSPIALSFQWRFNGVNIAGATGGTFTLPNITAAQDGIYSVVVSNSAGATESNAARLVVPVNFGQWKALYFSAGEQVDAAISGLAADPDGDGISNLQEFFHGTHPRQSLTAGERAALPALGAEPPTGTPQFLTLTYRVSARALLTVSELQASSTLGSGTWSTVTPDTTEQLGPEPGTGDPRVRVKVAVPAGETKKFLRLQLTP